LKRIIALTLVLCVAGVIAASMGTARSAKAASTSTKAIDPSNFVSEITNPWLPMRPGTTMVYKGVKDGLPSVVTVVVTHDTKTIVGVTTTVIHDTLMLKGKVREQTTDWYAQDKAGNVWYFGEDTKELDANGNVISTEGSWEAGVDGAQPGIFMTGNPKVGQSQRQEYYKGHAEDHFKILAFHQKVTVPFGSFKTAMMTKEWTPLEPTVLDHKYYVHGIGMVGELSVKGPVEKARLVQITTW